MNLKSMYGLVGGALLGAGGYYLARKSSPIREPGWAKDIRERLEIYRVNTLMNWDFIGSGGGSSDFHFESSNYAMWRPVVDVEGRDTLDFDAAIQLIRSHDARRVTVEILSPGGIVVYLDGQKLILEGTYMIKFELV